MLKRAFPPQVQMRQPGIEAEMRPLPDYAPRFAGSGRLTDKVAIISGGDSGIGRAVAVAMAREGAAVAILYLDEEADARKTVALVQAEGSDAIAVAGDIGSASFCQEAVKRAAARFGRIDIVVNNAAEQHAHQDIREIGERELERTFRTNVFSYFFLTQAAMPHLGRGASIINTTSITAYKGSHHLVDYAATRGAIVAFTRSLSQALVPKGIRVNAVAPGPVWTPLIPSSFVAERVASHGTSTPMGRAGQPYEIAPCYVFLASDEAAYISGQTLHPNGGTIVNG